MEILDYKTPEKPVSSKWRRRHWIFVPLIGCCYCVAWLLIFFAALHYMDAPPQSMPKSFDLLARIVGFPMYYIFDPGGLEPGIAIGLINAAIWGFSAVGACHAISLVLNHRRAQF